MFLCIDIGGTKTLIALLDSAGKILHSIQFPTIDDQTRFYKTLRQQLRASFVLSRVKVIAVAMPGIVKDNCAVYLGNLPWKNFDIASQLTADFAKPVFVNNDANLAGLAEARQASGRTLYLTLSTGIGGGIVDDGVIRQRHNDFEPGHLVYEYHGQSAEWEDIASANAIVRLHGKYVNEITDPDDWRDIAARIALGLAPLIRRYRPNRIILGGPLGLCLDNYRLPLRKLLRTALGDDVELPRLLCAKYGKFSVIHGCYLYAKSQLATR